MHQNNYVQNVSSHHADIPVVFWCNLSADLFDVCWNFPSKNVHWNMCHCTHLWWGLCESRRLASGIGRRPSHTPHHKCVHWWCELLATHDLLASAKQPTFWHKSAANIVASLNSTVQKASWPGFCLELCQHSHLTFLRLWSGKVRVFSRR